MAKPAEVTLQEILERLRSHEPLRARTFQVSVGTTPTRIVADNPKRKSIKITNVTGTQIIYLGFGPEVSSTTGDYLHSAAGSNTSMGVISAIWGIAITGAQTVTVMEEEYDDA